MAGALDRSRSVAAWTLLFLLASTASGILHLPSSPGRRWLARALSDYISSQMAGRLELGRIDALGTERVVVRHAALYEPGGQRVLTGDEIVIVPDLAAAWSGALRFRDARLSGGWLRLEEGQDGLPSFLAAFAPAEPAAPDAGPGLHALVDHLSLEGVTAYGELLGLRHLEARDVSAQGSLEVLGDVRIRVNSASADLVEPYPTPMHLERLVATVRGDPTLGTRLYADVRMPGERVEANMRYAAPPSEGAPEPADGSAPAMHLDLLLHAEPIRAQTVEDVGLTFASALGGEVRGYLRLFGPPDDLAMRAWLETDGGRVAAQGSLPAEAPFHVRLRTPGLDLAPVLPGAPPLHVSGSLTLTGGRTSDDPTALSLQLEPFEAFGMNLPGLELEGRMDDTGVHVDGAHARISGGRLDASGHVDFDGRMDLRVRARLPQVARDPRLRELLPGARGGLRADLHLRGDADSLATIGVLRMAPFAWGPLRADYIELRGGLDRVTSRPRGHTSLNAGGVSVSGFPIGTGTAQLRGGPTRWTADGHFRAPGERELTFGTDVTFTREALSVEARSFDIRRGEARYHGAIEGLVYRPGRDLTATRIALEHDAERLELSGRIAAHAPDDLRAHAEALDLRSVLQILPVELPEASGTLSGTLALSGEIDRSPVVHFEGGLADGALADLHRVTGSLTLNYEQGTLESRGRVVIGGGGALDFEGTGMLEDVGLERLLGGWRDGYYEAQLAGTELDIEGFAPLWPSVAPGLGGHVDLNLGFSGMVDAPTFRGGLTSHDLTPPGWPALEAMSQFEYDRGVLSTRGAVSDRDGELVEGELTFLADLPSLLAEPELAAELLAVAPWRVSLRVPPRVVARLPAPLREAAGEGLDPLMFSLSATLSGGSQPVRGDVSGNLDWAADFSELPCGNRAAPRALFTGELASGRLTATARVFSRDAPLMELSASADAPVERWLDRGETPSIPAVDLVARVADAPLAEIPYVCEHVGGRASFTLLASRLFGVAPELHLALDSQSITARRFEAASARRRVAGLQEETPATRLSARADLADGRLDADATLDFWNGGTLHARGTTGAHFEPGDPLPSLEDDAIEAHATLAGAPLEAVLTFVSGIERVSGLLDGELSIAGTPSSPELGGSLELSQGSLDIVGVGQRLERGRGDFIFAGDRVLLRDVAVSDGEGQARVSGEVGLDGFTPNKAAMRLVADAFPVRQEGSILATLDGRASLDVDILPERMQGELVIGDLNVLLSESSTRSTQALAPHPDITVVGERFTRAQDASPYPIALDVRAPTPFWVRGQDFSARVTANLAVQYTDPSFRVGGEMEIGRGFFEVFGKRFEVSQGAMGFDGGAELDPMVQLVAVHTLRDQSGDTVTVTASGRLSRPRIAFRTTVDGCDDEGQIIALLVSGSCQLLDHGTQTATDGGTQAAEFLQGLAFGVLTLSLREELGEYFPVIVVESGERGVGGTRIRAGFDARDLLPDAVRRVITGAYVEGSVDIAGADPNGAERQKPDVGFLMELRFPHDVVTTGRISINRNWSLDLTWEP